MTQSPRLWTPMDLIKVTAEFLADKDVPSPRLDAELLLGHVLGLSRLELYLDHARPIVPEELDRYRELVRRRSLREPLQLLVGEAHLLDHSFLVRPGVFIPRPETEVLVLRCRELDFSAFEGDAPSTIVEIGTGTGCVGLSLLTHWPTARMLGFDLSVDAVELTRENARRLGVDDRLEAVHGSPIGGARELPPCELLVSNPPYLASADLEGLEPEVRDHDPRAALDGGADGLDVIRALAREGLGVVRSGGWIALEHGYDQGETAPEVLRLEGWTQVVDHRDLAGQPRVVVGRRPGVPD